MHECIDIVHNLDKATDALVANFLGKDNLDIIIRTDSLPSASADRSPCRRHSGRSTPL
jgi:hypothetical protein